MVWAPRNLDNLLTDPKDALDVFDFEPVARKNLPPAHFGYLATGIDDEVTLRANREGFLKFQLRPRRLVVPVDVKRDWRYQTIFVSFLEGLAPICQQKAQSKRTGPSLPADPRPYPDQNSFRPKSGYNTAEIRLINFRTGSHYAMAQRTIRTRSNGCQD